MVPTGSSLGLGDTIQDTGELYGIDTERYTYCMVPTLVRVREPDLRGQHVSLSYAAHEADSDDDYAEQDDYTVEKILAQRPKASAPGGLEFKVRWRGYGPSHDTWEPVSSFVPRVNTPFMEYIRKHKTKIHVSDLAALTRAIAARGA